MVASKVHPQDDWFDDDDSIEEVIKKGLIDSTFIQFFGEKTKEEETSSAVSWGTENTTYTEIIASKDNGSIGISAITQNSETSLEEETKKRRDIVRV